MGRRSHSNCFSFMFQISDWIGDCISPQVRTFLEFFLLTSFVHLSIFFLKESEGLIFLVVLGRLLITRQKELR